MNDLRLEWHVAETLKQSVLGMLIDRNNLVPEGDVDGFNALLDCEELLGAFNHWGYLHTLERKGEIFIVDGEALGILKVVDGQTVLNVSCNE